MAGIVTLAPRSMSHSQSSRQVSSARARTRTGSCSTSFFVDISSDVRSTSRLEHCAALSEMSLDMRTKSRHLLARNLNQTQVFFDKLKAFIDFLNQPNYSKEEVRQKRLLADRITRLMFEEEQRLRRGLQLSEVAKLDRLLGPAAAPGRGRPASAYAAPPAPTAATPGEERPVLRRERTFDLETSSAVVQEVRARKARHRQSLPLPPPGDPGGWMGEAKEATEGAGRTWRAEGEATQSERRMAAPDSGGVVDDFNLLGYFQVPFPQHCSS